MEKEVTSNKKSNNTKVMTLKEQQELAKLIGDDKVVGKAIIYDIPTKKTQLSFEEVIQKAINENVNTIIFKSVASFVLAYNKPSIMGCVSLIRKLRDKKVNIFFSSEEINSIDPYYDFELGILLSLEYMWNYPKLKELSC